MPSITVTLRRERVTVETVTKTVEVDDEVARRFARNDPAPALWAEYGLAPTIPAADWKPDFPRPATIEVVTLKIENGEP